MDEQSSSESPEVPPQRPERRPLSKRLRFEVFKRDHFACVYCGRTPPTVTLQIDHYEAVASGGSDDVSNLFTACEDCNLGKSDRPMDNALPQIRPEEIDKLAERVEQMRQYQGWRREYERQLRLELPDIYEAWIDQFGGDRVESEGRVHYESDVDFPSEKVLIEYLEQLPVSEILDAVRNTGWRYRKRDVEPIERWRLRPYFYSICKNKIQRGDESRRQIRVTWMDLLNKVPELETVRSEVATFQPKDPWRFCGAGIWKNGWVSVFADGVRQDVPAPTERISGLVGPKSQNSRDPILGSLAAHDLAMRTVRDCLPPCGQTCSCGRPKRPPRPEDYPRCPDCGQLYLPVDRRESCVKMVHVWNDVEYFSIPYGREPWRNVVAIAENYGRWRRLATPRISEIPPRCSGCNAPIGGFHHRGCRGEACLVCGANIATERSPHDHRAEPMGVSPAQLRARIRQRAARRASVGANGGGSLGGDSASEPSGN